MHISLKHVLEENKLHCRSHNYITKRRFNVLILSKTCPWSSYQLVYLLQQELFSPSLQRLPRQAQQLKLRPVQNLGKLPHLVEPLWPCPRMFPLKLQVPLTAPTDWEEEGPEAMLPRPGQQLQRPPHLEWKEGPRLVWQVGSRCFLAFSTQKKPQPRLS